MRASGRLLPRWFSDPAPRVNLLAVTFPYSCLLWIFTKLSVCFSPICSFPGPVNLWHVKVPRSCEYSLSPFPPSWCHQVAPLLFSLNIHPTSHFEFLPKLQFSWCCFANFLSYSMGQTFPAGHFFAEIQVTRFVSHYIMHATWHTSSPYSDCACMYRW